MALLEEKVSSVSEILSLGGLVISATRPIAYGVQLTIGEGKETVPVNIYSGKKGISITVGGSANSAVKRKIEALLHVPSVGMGKSNVNKTEDEPLNFDGVEGFDGRWIGTDESGKGDFYGSLVVAAVLVDRGTEAVLIERGIKDCKALSDDKVRALAAVIREVCSGRYVEIELTPARYNEIYQQLRAEGKNLNQLLAWAHARAIEDVLQKEPCRFAISDQFADERQILSRLMEKGRKITLLQSHRAERNIAVAAASVLARDRFLARLQAFKAQYGFDFPKGASPAVISVGKRFSAEHGRNSLVNVAKLHFKTFDEI